jgi:hypothetical protein
MYENFPLKFFYQEILDMSTTSGKFIISLSNNYFILFQK